MSHNFLGTGWHFPPHLNPDTLDFACTREVENIEQSLFLLLSTEPGERLVFSDFGTPLSQVQFMPQHQATYTHIIALIKEAIQRFEPRIEIIQIQVAPQEKHGSLHINIDFKIRLTNVRHNMVYPFYLYEATDIPKEMK